jgi:hypothetical protein
MISRNIGLLSLQASHSTLQHTVRTHIVNTCSLFFFSLLILLAAIKMGLCGSKLLKKDIKGEAIEAPRPSVVTLVAPICSPPSDPTIVSSRGSAWVRKLGRCGSRLWKKDIEEDVLAPHPPVTSLDSQAMASTASPQGDDASMPGPRTPSPEPQHSREAPVLGYVFRVKHRKHQHTDEICSRCTSATMFSVVSDSSRWGKSQSSWESVVWYVDFLPFFFTS